ncbi:MAG: hypothetical protein GY776_12340 [Alteromonas sp.]|nr:hypothetical protein [Alteromonas sp.]
MTKTQSWIVRYLSKRGWCSPTQIGHAYGDSLHGNNSFHHYHSAWASPRCKALVKMGKLKRNDKGHYLLIEGEQNE